jgi:hypothetical protein
MNVANLRNVIECKKEVVNTNGTVIRAKYVGDPVCKQGDDLPELVLLSGVAVPDPYCNLILRPQSLALASLLH